MQRLIRISLICFVVLTLLCSAVIFVGRKQPDVPFVPELNSCDGSLCYLGILPGTTAWDQGMITVHYDSDLAKIEYSLNAYARVDNRYEVEVFPVKEYDYPNPKTISEIDLINFNQPFSIGDLINSFGVPCHVYRISSDRMLIGYANASAFVEAEPQSLTPTSPVQSISLTEPNNEVCIVGMAENGIRFSAWQGFRQYP